SRLRLSDLLGRGHGGFFGACFLRLSPLRSGGFVRYFDAFDEGADGYQEDSHDHQHGDKHRQVSETDSGARHDQSPGMRFSAKRTIPSGNRQTIWSGSGGAEGRRKLELHKAVPYRIS